MYLVVSIIVLGCLMAMVVHCWHDFSEHWEDYSRRWLLAWLQRGLLVPVLVWVMMNAGRMPFMPPLTRHIAQIRATGNIFEALLAQTVLAAVVIGSCWAALTLGWFMISLFKRARNTEDLVLATVVWCPVAIPVYWIFVDILGWSGATLASALWLWPLTKYSLNTAQFKQPPPAYSRAIGKIKFGKYREAELAIIGELEKCETDFDGWMMLAELYANQFRDLAEAERTICDLCDEPGTTLPQVSVALHRLADWQLQFRGDPVAARRVLEEIEKRMPGTHLALMARNRINQLPKSAKELDEQHQPRTVRMSWLNQKTAGDSEKGLKAVSPEEATNSVNKLVELLQADPNDAEARDKLARVFAEQMGQFDLAVEQLELLIGMPGQPPAKTAEWLALIAAWQIKHEGEGAAAMKTLERLIHEFPQSPQAFAAQRELSMMKMSAKLKRRVQVPAGEPQSAR